MPSTSELIDKAVESIVTTGQVIGASIGLIPSSNRVSDYAAQVKAKELHRLRDGEVEARTTTATASESVTSTTTTTVAAKPDESRRNAGHQHSSGGGGGGSGGGGGGGYTSSEAFLVRKYCHEQFPDFTQTDLYNECVSSQGISP